MQNGITGELQDALQVVLNGIKVSRAKRDVNRVTDGMRVVHARTNSEESEALLTVATGWMPDGYRQIV